MDGQRQDQPAAADNRGRAIQAALAEPASVVPWAASDASAGRTREAIIVAHARTLLIALRRYATAGVIIEGAMMKPATI